MILFENQTLLIYEITSQSLNFETIDWSPLKAIVLGPIRLYDSFFISESFQ